MDKNGLCIFNEAKDTQTPSQNKEKAGEMVKEGGIDYIRRWIDRRFCACQLSACAFSSLLFSFQFILEFPNLKYNTHRVCIYILYTEIQLV